MKYKLYRLLVDAKSNFLSNAKLYRYLFMENNKVLLDDYLLHSDLPLHLKYYYVKIKQFLDSENYTMANEMISRLVAHFDDSNLASLLELF